MECNEGEQLHIPMKGLEAFRLFKEIHGKARDELISIINSPLDAKNAQKTGSSTSASFGV